MSEVKVCGLVREDDVRAAADLGAWAIGMILSARGPRALDLARATRVRRAVPRGVLAVGVFVDEPAGFVASRAAELGLDLVQLQGEEPPELLAALPVPAVKAFAIDIAGGRPPPVDVLARYARAFAGLFDARVGSATGGTGRTFDWSCITDEVRAAAPSGKVVIAGGLTPENVGTAVARLHPFAVDVSSGVESSPGKKDPEKLRAFFRAATAR